MSLAQSIADLSFVHIPKNGGNSIVRAITDHQLPIRHSNHAYPARLSDSEFVVLRSPFERFVSAFHWERKYWSNPINDAFADADELARSAADPEHPKHPLALVEMGNEPEHFLLRNGKPTPQHTVGSRPTGYNWIFEPQTTWLVNEPVYLLRHRHLADDFLDLLRSLGWNGPVELPRLNESGGAERLSAPARDFIERTYRSDLDFIASRGLDV